jgi:hypothetical protein
MRQGSLARPGIRRSLDAAEAPSFGLHGKVLRSREARGIANLQLWLSNGETIQIRVEDADAELAALKSGTGRFTDELADSTGLRRP